MNINDLPEGLRQAMGLPDEATMEMREKDAENQLVTFVQSLSDDQLRMMRSVVGLGHDDHGTFIARTQQWFGILDYEYMLRMRGSVDAYLAHPVDGLPGSERVG